MTPAVLSRQHHSLAIGLTNRCPLRCDFCCVPPGKGDLSDAVVDRIVHEAVDIGAFSSVGFTGGEPLLRWRLVTRMGRILADAGIRWGFTTGLGWAKDRDHLLRVADQLLQAGVDHLTVSADPSHLAFVDRALVEYFLGHMGGAGVRRIIVSCTGPASVEEAPVTVPDLPNIETEFHYVAPVGYASGREPTPGSRRFDMTDSACPMRDGLTLSVWPDGTVYPCCSTYVVNKEANRDLALGSVLESTIEELLKRALADPYLSTIRQSGFAGLVVLDPDNLAWPSVFDSAQGPLLDPCHLCSRVSAERGTVQSLRSRLSDLITLGSSSSNL